MRPIYAGLITAALLAAPVSAADHRHCDDAPLRAIQFVDGNEGWAIGDEGVIWHTIDGGKHWERQPSGVRASLQAVHFLNPFTGWIVGREELPHGAGSVGVVLATNDGGLKWRRLSINRVPGLHCVRFFDDKFGIVAGEGSDQHPSGVFSTADGGRSWKPLSGPRCPTWLAADFSDSQAGVLAGSWSRLATVHQGSLGAADVDTLGGRSVRGVKLLGKQAVAVGQGGLVLVSSGSSGVRWGFADLKLPTEVLACLDFQALAAQGEHVWVVGRPGSVVLHSPDRGQSWQIQKTGQALPLNGICFINEQRGWAVGELGTVLTTSDGGQTWALQRQGGQRAAVMCVHARPADVPLGTLAMLGGDDGYLMTTLRITAADPASAPLGRSSESQRLGQAIRLAAGAAAETLWQFPLPEHAERLAKRALIASWDPLHGDKAAEQILRQMVLALRIWQPDVVLTDCPATDAPLEELVAEGIQEAFRRAADPQAFPEQIEHLGLKPWKVSKLYGRQKNTTDAPVVLDLRAVRQRLSGTPREYVAEAADVLADQAVTLPDEMAYRLLASRIDGAAKHRQLMEGIALAPGGTARRILEPQEEPDPAEEKALQKARALRSLLEKPTDALTDPNKLLAQIAPALTALPADQGAQAAFAIASQYASNGQWLLAREIFLLLVDRYPAHPLSADAYRWLIRYNCSSEARRRQELGQFLVMTRSEVRQAPTKGSDDGARIHGGPEDVQNRQLSLLGDQAEVRRWHEGALAIEPRLYGFGALFGNDPSVQFCLQAARRNLGQFDEARQWYSKFLTQQTEGPWHAAAAAELWLNNRSSTPPKPVVYCRQTAQRPFLDGNLDDACWQGMKPLKLRNVAGSTDKDYPTEAWLAYDKDFLYLALRCQHPAEQHVPPMKVRQRDADLQDFDRVGLMLDLDRDYSTYFHLQIDQRGCLAEDCWGDKSWNPRWFVAIRSEPTCWQIEAAIPLVELTGDALTIGRAWACNVVRVLPGRGVQAWSTPADVAPRPEGMGLMLFVPEQAKQPQVGQLTPPPSGN